MFHLLMDYFLHKRNIYFSMRALYKNHLHSPYFNHPLNTPNALFARFKVHHLTKRSSRKR